MSKRVAEKMNRRSSLHAFSQAMRQGMVHKIGVSMALISLATSLYAPAAMGQVISDPRAPIQFKPKVGISANGTTVIDITKPSFGGVSHNKFQRYDIDTRGVILNNSKLTGTSIIGGQVVANPNLNGQRPARVILNEVTSSAASTLNGPTEVFGSKADVIIANPNGVGCVGCSFINSGRITLSTGTPKPDYKRGTVKFDVSRGTVSVAGKGLLGIGTPLEDVDLIGRQLKINGPIQAQDTVRLRAGGMIYDQRGDRVTPKDLAQLPAFVGPAIQSRASGRIIAGTLSVLSRDMDVGIALAGDLSAFSDSITIKSYGDVSVAGARAQGDLQLTARGEVALTGGSQVPGRITASAKHIKVTVNAELVASDAIVMEALQSLASRGILKAGHAVSLVSGGQLIAEGIIASNGDIAFEGKTFAAKDLEISGRNVSVAGLESAQLDRTAVVATQESVKIASQTIALGAETAFQAKQQIVIDAKDRLTNGTVLNYKNLDLSVRNSFINTATGQLVQDKILLTLRDDIINAGTIYGRLSTAIRADLLNNTESGVIYGPEVTLVIGSDLKNLGRIVSDRTLKIVAGDISNDGTLQTGGILNLKGTSYRANSSAAVLAATTADLIVSGAFENSGEVLGVDRLALEAGNIVNKGSMQTGGALTVRTLSYRGDTTAAMLTGATVDLLVTDLFENKGQVTASGNLSLKAGVLANLAEASITAGVAQLDVVGNVTNDGTIGGVSELILTAGGDVTSAGALLASEGDLTLTASGRVTSGGDLIAQGTVSVAAAAFDGNAATGRLGGASIAVDVSGAFSFLGLISAQNGVTVTAGSILLGPSHEIGAAGTLVGKSVVLTSRGDIDNQGTISGLDGLTLSSAGTVINSGILTTDQTLQLTAAAYRSTAQGQLGGKQVVFRLTGSLENLGFISGADLVDIQAASVLNGPTIADSNAGQILGNVIKLGSTTRKLGHLTNNGAIEAADQITIAAVALSNSGSLIANGSATITASGHVSNSGTIGSGETLTLTAGSYTASVNTALLSSKDITVQSGAVDNAGTIFGLTSLTFTSGTLINRGASSSIGGATATIVTNGNLSNTGQISADGDFDLTVHGALTNTGKILTGVGNLTLVADDGVSSTGILAAAGSLAITAASFANASTTAQMGGHSVVVHLSGDFSNKGLISSETSLDIKSRKFLNGPAGEKAGLIAADTMVITALSDVVNQGILHTRDSLILTGSAGLSNTGTIASDDSLLLNVTKAITNQKQIAATTLTLKGASYNGSASSSLNGFDITINLPGDFTNAGKIDARSQLKLTANDVTNTSSGVMGAHAFDVTASGNLANAGIIKGQLFGELNVEGALTNTGKIQSLDDLMIKVKGALDNSALIQAKDILVISAGPVTNRSAAHLQGKAISLTSTGDVVNAGVVDGIDAIVIKAGSLINQGASASDYASISSDVLSVDVSGTLTLGANSLLQGKNDAIIKAKTVSAGFFTNDTIAAGRFVFGNNLDFTLTEGGWTFTDDFKAKGDLSFKVAGDIVNLATVAAGGSLALISTGGSITNGANDPTAPGGGMIYSNGDMVLKAAQDLRNYASVIQSGGNLLIDVGGQLINTRTDRISVDDGSELTNRAPYDYGKYTSYFTRDLETSGPATIQAQGLVAIKADYVLNQASTIAAGADLLITARKVDHLARTLYRHEVVIKTGGTVNIGNEFGRVDYVLSETQALLYAAGTLQINTTEGYTQTGTVQANAVTIKGPSVTIGITDPSLPAAPSRIPDPVINLADALGLVGPGLVPGSGPAYVPGPEAGSGTVEGKAGDKLSAAVDANGKPIKRPDDTKVTVSGRVSFLYATPVPSGQNERNPSWIFSQVGASAANLTFFADPATERRLIQQALLEQTGRAILDPKYRNPQEQQEALYEATVDYLRENGNIKLGDKLTKAQRAKITKPILWYEYQVVNGKKVLVPQLILPEKDLAKYATVTGGAMFANHISIQGDKVTNTGTILAINSLSIDAKEFLNEKRVAGTGAADGFSVQVGGVLGGKVIVIKTTGDLINRGGSITAGNTLQMTAGGNIRIEAQTVTNHAYAGNTKSWTYTTDVSHVSGLVSSGGNLVIKAEKALDILGSTVTAKNDALLVGKEGVTIASVLDRQEVTGGGKKSSLLSKSSHSSYDMSLTNLSSVVSAGKNLTVRSETGDITVAASHLMARNDLAVLAGYDETGKAVKGSKASVHVLSEQDVKQTAFSQKKSGIGLFFTGNGVDIYRSTQTASTTSEARNVASSLSADGNLVVKATRDIAIMGSVVAAKGTVTIDAKRDVIVGTGLDASGSTSSRKEKGIGLTWSGGNGGFSVGAGYHASSRTAAYDKVSVAQSIITGDKGVSITAGDDITLVAAHVISGGQVRLDAGDDISLLAGQNRESAYQSSKEMFAGITLKVGQNVTGAAQQLQHSASTFTSGYGGAGYQVLGQVSGVLQATDALKSLTNPSVGISLMQGVSVSSSRSQAAASHAVATTITAGSLRMKAGDDIHLVGMQVKMKKDIALTAGGDLTVESAQSYASAKSAIHSPCLAWIGIGSKPWKISVHTQDAKGVSRHVGEPMTSFRRALEEFTQSLLLEINSI
jgi:filamentous hemagglutinin